MEPMIEGLIEVSSPPQSAGRRGRVTNRDWAAIVEVLRARPWRWYLARNEPAANVPRLRERYPDIEFAGHNRHLAQTARNGAYREVADLYVRSTGKRAAP